MLNDVGHVKTCAMEQFKLKVKTRWSWKIVILYFVSIACCYRFSSNSKSNNWQAVVEIGALKKENKSKKNKYEKEEQEEENKSEEDDEGEEYHNKPKITVKQPRVTVATEEGSFQLNPTSDRSNSDGYTNNNNI
ncbi:hypothetical protein ACTFIR_011926 [Dictyostelium discoideum]